MENIALVLLFNKLFICPSYVLSANMEDAEKENVPNISIGDAILILLYANKKKPISGRLMLVKQVFLLAKEIIPSLKSKLDFFASNYGPFSSKFAQESDRLIAENYIDVEHIREGDFERYEFSLTKKGEEHARRVFENLPENLQRKIERKRKGWDQLGYRGILNLVYSKYPEYAVRSKVKERINNGY